MDYQMESMKIIAQSGKGKSFALEAMNHARKNAFLEADACLKKSEEALREAFLISEQLFQKEIMEEAISVLLVHAMDILTNANTVYELSVEIIALYKRIE